MERGAHFNSCCLARADVIGLARADSDPNAMIIASGRISFWEPVDLKNTFHNAFTSSFMHHVTPA
eukprot:656092-Prymnesium_polylepis.1